MSQLKIVRNRLWPALDYVPHTGQELIHNSNARMRVVSAGRRFGKSHVGGHELTVEALATKLVADELLAQGKRREFWIVGPEYSDSEKEFRVFWNDLKRLEVPMDHPGSYNNTESGQMVVSLWGGAFLVHAKSAKYPSSLVGEGLSGVILAEAAKLKQLVWTKYIRPTLADFKGWALFTSTPEGRNWFYELWRRGQNPNDKAWASWRMPSWRNNHVYRTPTDLEAVAQVQKMLRENIPFTTEQAVALGVDAEVVDMMMDMTEERFNQEIAALFTEFVGRVFKDFDEEVHVKSLRYNPDWPLYLATDYGWTNPFVCLFIQKDVWDNIYVIAEYRQTHRDITDIASDLANLPYTKFATNLYPDPEAPGDTNVLAQKLRVKPQKNTGGELKWRLELIRQHLKLGPPGAPEHAKEPKLFIDRSCVELIREMSEYRYPDSKEEQDRYAPENPMKKDDHGPEALGRFFRGYFGAPAAGKNRARIAPSTMSG